MVLVRVMLRFVQRAVIQSENRSACDDASLHTILACYCVDVHQTKNQARFLPRANTVVSHTFSKKVAHANVYSMCERPRSAGVLPTLLKR